MKEGEKTNYERSRYHRIKEIAPCASISELPSNKSIMPGYMHFSSSQCSASLRKFRPSNPENKFRGEGATPSPFANAPAGKLRRKKRKKKTFSYPLQPHS